MPSKAPQARRGRKCRHAQHDQARGSSASRGYGADHRRWREAVLRRDPLCVECRKRGRTTPATVADHVIPIAVAPERRLDLDNGRGLCASCHALITDRFKREGVNEMPEQSA